MSWAKILEFALKNWKEIAVVLSLLAVSVKTRMDYHTLNKAYEISQEETKERIEALQYIHSEELARRDDALKTYKRALTQLRDNYEESQNELEEQKRDRAEQLEKQYSQNKEALTNEIINTYGFEFVE